MLYHIGSIFAACASKKTFEKLTGKDPEDFWDMRELRTVFSAMAPMMAFEHPCLFKQCIKTICQVTLAALPVDGIDSHDAVTNGNPVIGKIVSLMITNV